MFGKKKEAAPLKNQPRSQESTAKRRRSFSFFKTKNKKTDKKEPASKIKLKRMLINVLDGSFLVDGRLINYAGIIGFAFVLTIASIGNSYIVERRISRIEKLKKENKDLRDEYISTKSQLMYYTKMSEVAKKLEGRGIKSPLRPSFKLIVSKKGKKDE
ncbi:MAG: hypothetical protein KAG64_08240 [Bacteroidales bacterium]|nr:hypothetical protein [Bacteroidales bacterium]